MKILGKVSGGYIAEISHREIEKVADRYYSDTKIKELNIGQEYPISQGYDFRGDIRESCQQMTQAMEVFARCQESLRAFAAMVLESNEADGEIKEAING